MKRLICLLLVLLAFTGCGKEAQETQPPLETTAAPVTEPPGSYDPDSTLEMFTEGAIRAYPQNIPEVYAIAAAGSDVIVFSGRGNTTLTRLTGENLFRIAETTLNVQLMPGSPELLITADRMVYYDPDTRELVWLDEYFREFSRLQLPEDMVAAPVITEDRLHVYYCTAEGLRVLDVESGISRLLKQMSYPDQLVQGLLMEDTVVKLHILDEGLNERDLFLDAATGQLLEETTGVANIYSHGGLYCGYRMETDEMSLILGLAEERTRVLRPADPNGATTLLPQSGGAVTYGDREDRWQLEYYDLASGCRTAQTYLPESVNPWQYAGDDQGKYLYFLTHGEAESEILCRWDLSKSLTEDETVYTGIWYTREAPDTEGLARCAARAAALGQQYGLAIHVYEDALTVQPWDYEMEVCWQVPEIEAQLDELEAMLAVLPESFLPLTMETLEGTMHLSLVGSLRGNYESGSLETADGIQFWVDNDAYIALVPGERFVPTFFHELFHVMETRILSKSIAYYRWDELNPKGFEYDYDYIENQFRDGSFYLDDNTTRAFIDAYSMSFPKEDRARIFEYACQEGNGDYFISATMQKKLRTLCEGIREAYGLKKSPEIYLWEQYLESPLAYTKK